MYGAAIKCSRVTISFIRWDGTLLVSRLRTMRLRWVFIRQNLQQTNIKNIKRQINEIAAIYDWDMEVNTTDPEFYKWTQWIFVKMFKEGLAYEKEFPINWCPSCKTGLANEEVVNGKCERCGTPKLPRKTCVSGCSVSQNMQTDC
jgi:methionyl-tRNA synthetase